MEICAFGNLVCGDPIGVYLVLVILSFISVAAIFFAGLIVCSFLFWRD